MDVLARSGPVRVPAEQNSARHQALGRDTLWRASVRCIHPLGSSRAHGVEAEAQTCEVQSRSAGSTLADFIRGHEGNKLEFVSPSALIAGDPALKTRSRIAISLSRIMTRMPFRFSNGGARLRTCFPGETCGPFRKPGQQCAPAAGTFAVRSVLTVCTGQARLCRSVSPAVAGWQPLGRCKLLGRLDVLLVHFDVEIVRGQYLPGCGGHASGKRLCFGPFSLSCQ